jgi:hypothetical protein
MRSTSLIEHQLLPRAERELFQYEIVRFHLEDLNALAERRRGRKGRAAVASPDVRRAAAIIQAATWDRVGFLKAIRRFIDEGRAEGFDAFGPALLLIALHDDDEAFTSAASPSAVRLARSVLNEAGFEMAPGSRRGSPSRKTRARRL